MSVLRTYRLFISHAWRYHDDYYRIVNLLNAAPRFSWSNYSVPRHDPVIANNSTALARELDDQMRFAEVIVVLAGIYVTHSAWIQYEIDRAVQWEKNILGVQPWGSARTPLAIQQNAAEVVGWNTASITSAVRRLAG
jgi:hypothetical protein